MIEVHDKDSGAILFKKDTNEKKVEELEKSYSALYEELEALKKRFSETKKS